MISTDKYSFYRTVFKILGNLGLARKRLVQVNVGQDDDNYIRQVLLVGNHTYRYGNN